MNKHKAIQNAIFPLKNSAPSMSLVVILSLGTFIVFFQGFMVAPIMPQLASLFHVSVQKVSFIEPAYLLSYGISTLFYTPLSDKFGRLPVITFSITGFIVLTACTGFVNSVNEMIVLRLLTGCISGGVAPTTISWIGDQFPYEKRGHALGIFFGFMAGGTAFGSSAGALLTGIVGWRFLFWIVSIIGLVILVIIQLNRRSFTQLNSETSISPRQMFVAYKNLLQLSRARRTYVYVFLNSMFHSGVFAWVGYFFYKNYQLNETAIGYALLGYGIPGLILGPFLGKLADKYGRNRIIPIGIFIGALSAFLLGMNYSLLLSCLIIASLSLAFDMTHPLFAAISTTLSKQKGVAIGFFAFIMFMGYGVGSLVFSLIINLGINESLKIFGFFALIVAAFSLFSFKSEK